MWKAKTKSRTNAYGVAKIVRHTYNTVAGMSVKSGDGWWAIRKKVFQRDGGLCVPCKHSGKNVKGVDVHHITPLSRGGTTTMANLITLCKRCHDRRHTHLFRQRG